MKNNPVGNVDYAPPMQYSPVNTPQSYNPYSGYYSNPYTYYPPQNYYPYYYDSDRYYVPPIGYRGREDNSYYHSKSSTNNSAVDSKY